METIRLIGRNSRLSLLQLEKVRNRIEQAIPGLSVEVLARSSRGDELQDIPLQTVEGSDFFTQDIFDALSNGEADIAVHSLKDMSSEHFFGENRFAVIDRDDVRDVAIFRPDIFTRLATGEPIIIGTCSPRREEMAIGFLKKSLPALGKEISIETKIIRGNVDTRLRKLDAGEYDGIILATAGLNRLLESEVDKLVITELLKNKRIQLLPLIECVPAPCQGAIVAEANPNNEWAVEVLNRIADRQLSEDCIQEKRIASEYGVGCLQRFGVTTIHYGARRVHYAAGKDKHGSSFSQWTGLPQFSLEGMSVFSSTDHMGSFFGYDYTDENITIAEEMVYVANYKAVVKDQLVDQLKSKRVWAAGTKTWFALAKQGIWVEGSADAFGLAFIEGVWRVPLVSLKKEQFAIITNNQSTDNWTTKGWKAYGTYSLVEKRVPGIEVELSRADFIFWTSARQYQAYRNLVRPQAIHACPYGETAELLSAEGIEPIVFPTIKAFQQWRQTFFPSPSVA